MRNQCFNCMPRNSEGLPLEPSKKNFDNHHSQLWFDSTDGKDLQQLTANDKGGNWISGHSGLLKKSDFSALLKLRMGRLETKETCNRGRRTNKSCRACHVRTETQHHILSTCPKTHALRIHRHDRIGDLLKQHAEVVGFQTIKEPRFATSLGLRKPDLIVYNTTKALIVDVTIVNEEYHLDGVHQDLEWHWNNKISNYDVEDITAKTKTITSSEEVSVMALVISIRGIWFHKNDKVLEYLGIRKSNRELFTLRVMESSISIWRNFMKND